jgi:hypothetical protein
LSFAIPSLFFPYLPLPYLTFPYLAELTTIVHHVDECIQREISAFAFSEREERERDTYRADTKKQKQIGRERQTESERQTEAITDRQTDTQTDTETEVHASIYSYPFVSGALQAASIPEDAYIPIIQSSTAVS